MKVLSKLDEQRQLYYDSLNEDLKREYFCSFFINEVISTLKRKRKELNISQKEIAKIMNVKQSYISKLENYSKIPTLTMVAKYCYALNYTFEQIKNISNQFIETPSKEINAELYTCTIQNKSLLNNDFIPSIKDLRIVNNCAFTSITKEHILKNEK